MAAMETMGDRIRRLREAKGWSQKELADELVRIEAVPTLSRIAVSHWERGETQNIKNRTFRGLVKILGTTEDYLLFGPDRSTGNPSGGGASLHHGKKA